MKFTIKLFLVSFILVQSARMQADACLLDVVNDAKSDVFIADPNSGRAVYIPARTLLPNKAKVMDATVAGIRSWWTTATADVWVQDNNDMFARAYSVGQKSCSSKPVKLMINDLSRLAGKKSSNLAVEKIKRQKLGKDVCNVAFTNDVAYDVFVLNPDSGQGISLASSRLGGWIRGTTQSIATASTLDVYVLDQSANDEYYKKFSVDVECGGKDVAVKVSRLAQISKKPSAHLTVTQHAYHKAAPSPAEQKKQATQQALAHSIAQARQAIMGDGNDTQRVQKICDESVNPEQCYERTMAPEINDLDLDV